MDQETARKVCQLIAGIVIADDDLDPAEEQFIDRLLARFGLSESDRDALFPIADASEAKQSMLALDADLREEALELLIDAAVADGKVVDEERVYLSAVAEAIGLDETALEQRIQARVAS